jgi:hypothetical protein
MTGSQTSSLLILCLIYFIFATNLVPMSEKSNEKGKRPRVVPTLEKKLKTIADFQAGKQAVHIRCEHVMKLTTVRTIIPDKQKYKDVAKLAVPVTY